MSNEINVSIKEIETATYSIALVQAVDNKYYILYGRTHDGIINRSEGIADFNMANYLFDIKLDELEKVH